jgi:hypothetical protein
MLNARILEPTELCAWCSKVLTQGKPGDGITHAVCPACAESVIKQNGQSWPTEQRS